MKCNKCGSDNPQDTLFCEQCDHRLDQPYSPKIFPREYLVYTAFALGIVSIVSWFFEVWISAVAAGAVGMMLGGYSITFVRLAEKKNKMLMIALAAAVICTSVIGFMFGFAGLV